MKEKKESAAKVLSISTRFLNSTGEISKALYLATHPDEVDEAPRSARVEPEISESRQQAAA